MWREELLEEQFKLTPRYRRAKRFSNIIMHILLDFLPGEQTCLRHIEQHVTLKAFLNKAEIMIPECDEIGREQFVKEQCKNTMHYVGRWRNSKRAREVKAVTEIRTRLREEFLEERLKKTPRYRRAKLFMDDIYRMLFELLPGDRHCLRPILEHVMHTAFHVNAEIIIPGRLEMYHGVPENFFRVSKLAAAKPSRQPSLQRSNNG
jgi:hypothetical protein